MTIATIGFEREAVISDGQGGTLASAPEVVYQCRAEWEAMPTSRLLEANQTRLQQGYRFVIWITNAFEPKTSDTILFLDERLTIQGFRYTDETRRKYTIDALEQTHAS